jgi:hypothetical protein
MSKITQNELRRLVRRAQVSDQETFEMTEEIKDNPQAAEMRRKLKGRLEAWEAVLTALQGDPALLRLLAE